MCFTSREEELMARELRRAEQERESAEPAGEEHSPEAPAADERERERELVAI